MSKRFETIISQYGNGSIDFKLVEGGIAKAQFIYGDNLDRVEIIANETRKSDGFLMYTMLIKSASSSMAIGIVQRCSGGDLEFHS